MASSSTSAQKRSIACPKQYDAFISHRGPDVKETLAKQLYERLQKRGYRAFLDREEIEGGDSIPDAIRNGIRSSAVQIAIFSKGYAKSSWCLDELVLMLEQTDALFIPVFYDVEPKELRSTDRGAYATAFSYYQSKENYLHKLDVWKKGLASAADISGYERSQHQENLCEKIVSCVVQEMQKRIPLHVAKYPIALDELVQEFEMCCPQTAGLVGIFGLGGAGKTTLAKKLFNKKREKYDASSFLSDVRESHANRQLHSLQCQLFKDLFDEDPKFSNINEGIARLKYRLGGARDWRFLIILDDVDHPNQLDALLPQGEGMLSSGSLVIITTRDQSVLTAADVSIRYKMKALERGRAKELFCSHAFRTRDSPTAYKKLVEGFVEFCRGLPLSLIVLGAHLRGRDEHYWRLELEKVKKIPPEEIMQRLKISFDGLNKEEKQIFIDIACLFNKKQFPEIQQWNFEKERFLKSLNEPPTIYIRAWQRKMSYREITPISIWKTSGWSAEHAVQTLQDKCLIEVKVKDYYSWSFEMHDHLRDLGRQMADELGPPRLWKPDILRSMEAKGFKHILAETKARCFNSFRNPFLRSKINYFIGSLNDSAETELLWLEINKDGGVLKQIPSWIPLRKLHYLFVENMEELWNSFQQQMQTSSQSCCEWQASFQLRRLHIFNSPLLQRLPKLGQLERLNTLDLQYCYKLETISGLSSLIELKSLKVNWCTKLETISGLSSLTGLQSLHVHRCPQLETVSKLSSLTGLQSLHVQQCPKLEIIFRLSSLTELQSLHVQECSKCELMFCEEFKTAANLRYLERIAILGCELRQNVQGFEKLQRFKSLMIEVPENGYAWVRNCIHVLRRLPSECTVLIGNAVDEAISRLNVNLFSEVIDGPTIHEIDTKVETVHIRSSSSTITIYALLCECEKIEFNAYLWIPYSYFFKSSTGHVMITVILPPQGQSEFTVLRRQDGFHGRVEKGFKATLNGGEEGKALTVLQSLVDRLYG